MPRANRRDNRQTNQPSLVRLFSVWIFSERESNMLFVVVIPTAEYEQQILYGVLLEETPSDIFSTSPPKISNMDK